MRREQHRRRRDEIEGPGIGDDSVAQMFQESVVEVVEDGILGIQGRSLGLSLLGCFALMWGGGKEVLEEGLEEDEFPPGAPPSVAQAAETEDEAAVYG